MKKLPGIMIKLWTDSGAVELHSMRNLQIYFLNGKMRYLIHFYAHITIESCPMHIPKTLTAACAHTFLFQGE